MLLRKDIQVLIFEVNNQTIELIGEVNQMSQMLWPNKYVGYGDFELWAPVTEENNRLFQKGRVLWCGGEHAAMIEIVNPSTDSAGTMTYNIKGRTLEKILTERAVWQTQAYYNRYVSSIMYDLVNVNLVSSADDWRNFPHLQIGTDDYLGPRIDYQKTGNSVYDSCLALANSHGLGFDIIFDPRNLTMTFKVTQGVDRTYEQTTVEPVVFDSDMEDILSDSYYTNNQDERNMAYVAGEDTGSYRRRVTVGESAAVGYDRKELWVDARDIRSTIQNPDGTSIPISDSDYNAMLFQRGQEKLNDYPLIETFEAKLRIFGDIQYEYGIDYFKGDKVTIIDRRIGVSVSATITEVEEEITSDYALTLTFGYSYPTIFQKVVNQLT